MTISETISAWLEKRKQQKEMEKQMIEEDRIITKVQQKKKQPMERELEKYREQDRQKAITDEVLKRRREKKYELEMRNIPINQAAIFRNEPKTFSSKNIFINKPKKPEPSIFNSKNIFTERRKK